MNLLVPFFVVIFVFAGTSKACDPCPHIPCEQCNPCSSCEQRNCQNRGSNCNLPCQSTRNCNTDCSNHRQTDCSEQHPSPEPQKQTTSQTLPEPVPEPTVQPSPSPVVIVNEQKKEPDVTNINNNVTLVNIITNQNRVNTSVTFNANTVNNIRIIGGKNEIVEWPSTPTTKTTTSTEPEYVTFTIPVDFVTEMSTTAISTTTRKPITYPPPVLPRPVPKFPIYPMLPPVDPTPRCCIIMQPCLSPNCYPYIFSCGTYCNQNYINYIPENPCFDGGCFKRDHWNQRLCTPMGSCYHRPINCDNCSEDFYTRLELYQQCRGCYYR